MTNREINEDYKKLFILNMEIAGEESKIDSYAKAGEILENEESKHLLESVTEDDAPLEIYIGMCILCVLREMYTIEKLCEFSDEKLNECFHAIYDLYLEKPTRKFVASRGIPKLRDLNELFVKVGRIKLNNNNKDEE